MTNFDYIKQNLTELDLAYYEFPYSLPIEKRPPLFSEKIYGAFDKWANSCSSNYGNMARGCTSGDHVIEENPSIWAWEKWRYPDGEWRKSGRNRIVAFLVWLSMQYKAEEWNLVEDPINPQYSSPINPDCLKDLKELEYEDPRNA